MLINIKKKKQKSEILSCREHVLSWCEITVLGGENLLWTFLFVVEEMSWHQSKCTYMSAVRWNWEVDLDCIWKQRKNKKLSLLGIKDLLHGRQRSTVIIVIISIIASGFVSAQKCSLVVQIFTKCCCYCVSCWFSPVFFIFNFIPWKSCSWP